MAIEKWSHSHRHWHTCSRATCAAEAIERCRATQDGRYHQPSQKNGAILSNTHISSSVTFPCYGSAPNGCWVQMRNVSNSKRSKEKRTHTFGFLLILLPFSDTYVRSGVGFPFADQKNVPWPPNTLRTLCVVTRDERVCKSVYGWMKKCTIGSEFFFCFSLWSRTPELEAQAKHRCYGSDSHNNNKEKKEIRTYAELNRR